MSPHQHQFDNGNAALYFPIAVYIECILYGSYTGLFITTLWIWNQQKSKGGLMSLSPLFSVVLLILMWIVASGHLVVSITRLLRTYILEVDAHNTGFGYYIRLMDGRNWDTQTHMSLVGTMVGLGDILVIYRAYMVWDRNIFAVLLPILIDIANFVVTVMAIHSFANPEHIPIETAYIWYTPAFPLAFIQNVITTSLLWYKIWTQHRDSVANGAFNGGGGISLGYLSRVMIETAGIYPLQILLQIILNALQHPAACMVTLFMIPTIGIVFVLMAVRVYLGCSLRLSRNNDTSTTPGLPTWARREPSENDGDEGNQGLDSASGEISSRLECKISHRRNGSNQVPPDDVKPVGCNI